MAFSFKDHPLARYASLVFKILLSAALLYWITKRVKFAPLYHFIVNNPQNVLLVFILAVLHICNEFIRFLLVIRFGKFPYTIKQLFKAFFIGYAFRFLLPGGQGEVGKMLYIEGRKSHRLAAYVLEKVSQIYVLLLFFGLAIAHLFPDYWLLGWGITGILAIAVIFWNRLIQSRFIRPYAPERFGSRKFFLLESALGAINLLLIILEYEVFIRDFSVGFFDVSSIVVVVLTIILIPISFAGLGLRETAASHLFHQFGVPLDIGIGVPLIIFTFNVVTPAIIGVVTFLVTRSKMHGISFGEFLGKQQS